MTQGKFGKNMKFKLTIGLLLLLTTKILTINAVTMTDIRLDVPPIATKSIEKRVYTKDEVLSLIEKVAQQKSISALTLKTIIACESQYNVYALGDAGHSRGLVQIYDSYHPKITHAQAYDPEFSINFLADQLLLGKGNMWTCYRTQISG